MPPPAPAGTRPRGPGARAGRFWVGERSRAIAARWGHGGRATSIAQVIAFRTLAIAVNIATSLLTAAVLGPGGRGEQAALVLAPTFLGGLASLGLHGALIYNVRADPEHERELLGNGILLTLLAGSAATVAGWIAEPYWLHQYSAHTILVGRLLLLLTPLVVVGWTLAGAAESRGWFGLVNRLLYLQSLATLAMLGALVWLHRLTPTTAAAAYLLPTVATFVYLFAQILRRLRPSFRPQRRLATRLLRYGVRLCGVDVLGTLSGSIDQLVIVAFLPAGATGTYVVALSSARLLTVVQGGIGTVLFPSIAARDPATILQTVATVFRIATLLTACFAAVLVLLAPQLLLLAYGAKFAAAILLFRVLLLAMVAETGARILNLVYSGNGRPELLALFEGGATLFSVLLMLLLVPGFGALGAAVAVLGTSMFRLAVAIGGLVLLLRVKLPRLVAGWHDLMLLRALLSRLAGATPLPPALPAVP